MYPLKQSYNFDTTGFIITSTSPIPAVTLELTRLRKHPGFQINSVTESIDKDFSFTLDTLVIIGRNYGLFVVVISFISTIHQMCYRISLLFTAA